jgi:hypothetical protein
MSSLAAFSCPGLDANLIHPNVRQVLLEQCGANAYAAERRRTEHASLVTLLHVAARDGHDSLLGLLWKHMKT